MSDKPWRAKQFMGGYSAEFIPAHQRTWRILKSGGKPVVYATRAAANEAAMNAFLASVDGRVRTTIEIDPKTAEARLEAKWRDEAENWLQSKRADAKAKTTLHRPGKKKVIVMTGRAMA